MSGVYFTFERGDDDVCAFSLARRRHIDAVDGFVSFRFVDDEGDEG